MKHIDVNYLNNFNNALRSKTSANAIIEFAKSFDKDAAEYTFDSYLRFDPKDYEWLDEFSNVINCVRSIVMKPRIHVKIEKEILKADVANQVDIAGFNMTVRDSKLWKLNEIGENVPESVYANIAEDDITIYENRFITSLINRMYEILSRNILKLYNEIISLDLLVGKTNKVVSNLDVFNSKNEKDIDFILKDVLTKSDDPMLDVLQRMILVKKRIIQIMGTFFYRRCMKAAPLALANVMQTNILIHEASYRYCYMYSRKILNMNALNTESVIKTSTYANYVLVCLLNAFIRNGFKISKTDNVEFKNNRLTVNNLSISKGDFHILLDTAQKAIQLKTYYKPSPKKVNDDFAVNTSITQIKYVLDSVSDAELKDIINNTCITYHNCIIATPNVVSHIDGVYTIAPSFALTERNFDDLIRSLTIILEGSSFVYSAKCPVCGSRIVVFDDNINAYEDLTCGSLWSMIEEDGHEMIWIKRFNP